MISKMKSEKGVHSGDTKSIFELDFEILETSCNTASVC
jgi:hypothetical protein